MAAIMQKTGSNAVTVKGGEEEAPPPPAFSRSTDEAAPPGGLSASGLLKSQVRSVVKAVSRAWKNPPGVVILDGMHEAPEAVQAENERQKAKGAVGEPEGFTYDGKVYIIASQMGTPGDVARVLLHEALGHFGLRGVFGQDLHKVLKQVAGLRRRDIEAKAIQYGLDMGKESDRLIAAEEVLSELAQTNPKSGLMQRAIAAIKKWIREYVPGFEDMQLSDSEIIEQYLVPARQFVQQGGTAAPGALAGAFSRKEVADFAKAVDDALDRKSDAAIRIGNTPHALRQATLPKRSLWVTKRVIDKLYRDHGLSREKIKSLPELLANPVMVLDSPTEPGSFVVLTTETHKGKPVIATIKPNGEVANIRPVNVVTSAYEKPHRLIADWMLGGKLIASDHEKALAWITTLGLKLPRRTPEVTVAPESDRTGRGHSILLQLQEAVRKSLPINVPKKDGDVNLSRSVPQIDTPAFRKWFGDSKVVDKDGKPLVVYRGQHGEGDNLHTRHGSISFGNKETANTYAMYPNDRGKDAEAASSKVMPVYLSIQNPIINDKEDPFIDLGRIRDALGEKEARRIALKFAGAIEYTGNWMEDLSQRYDSVAEMLDKDLDALNKLYFDAFRYLDDAEETAKLKQAGFDGAIHGGNGESALSAEYKVFSETQVKSAIGNSDGFDTANSDIRFSRSSPAVAIPAGGSRFPSIAPFRARMDKIIDSLIYNFQERFKPLKDIQKRASIVLEAEDAALAEERYSGTVRARIDEFKAQLRDPLIKAIHESGMAYDDVGALAHCTMS